MRTLRARSASNDRQPGRDGDGLVVTMMDQINEYFHSDSVSNINTIVYHSRASPATFISISFRNIEDRLFPNKIYQVECEIRVKSFRSVNI